MDILVSAFLERNFGDDLMIRILADRFPGHTFYLRCDTLENFVSFETTQNIRRIGENEDFSRFGIHVTIGGSVVRIETKSRFLIYLRSFRSQKKFFSQFPRSYFIGGNLGPFLNKTAQWMACQIISSYTAMSLRDEWSCEFVKKRLKTPVQLRPDIAFSIPGHMLGEPAKEKRPPVLGITALNFFQDNNNNYHLNRFLAKAADEFIARADSGKLKAKVRVKIFVFCAGFCNDYPSAYDIMENIGGRGNVEIIAHTGNGDNILRELRECTHMIPVRFHGAIMSLRLGIPFVPVIYDRKIDHMLDDFGYDRTRLNFQEISKYDPAKTVAELLRMDAFALDDKVFQRAGEHFDIINN